MSSSNVLCCMADIKVNQGIRINLLTVNHIDESMDVWRCCEYLVVALVGTAGSQDDKGRKDVIFK